MDVNIRNNTKKTTLFALLAGIFSMTALLIPVIKRVLALVMGILLPFVYRDGSEIYLYIERLFYNIADILFPTGYAAIATGAQDMYEHVATGLFSIAVVLFFVALAIAGTVFCFMKKRNLGFVIVSLGGLVMLGCISLLPVFSSIDAITRNINWIIELLDYNSNIYREYIVNFIITAVAETLSVVSRFALLPALLTTALLVFFSGIEPLKPYIKVRKVFFIIHAVFTAIYAIFACGSSVTYLASWIYSFARYGFVGNTYGTIVNIITTVVVICPIIVSLISVAALIFLGLYLASPSPQKPKKIKEKKIKEKKKKEKKVRVEKVPAAPVRTLDSDIEDIKKYKKLLDEGIITEEEFDLKKKELLKL